MNKYSPAAALAGDTLVHTLYHYRGRPRPVVIADVEDLLHDQARQLGRRPTGPVTWEPPAPRIRDGLFASVARLPTELIADRQETSG